MPIPDRSRNKNGTIRRKRSDVGKVRHNKINIDSKTIDNIRCSWEKDMPEPDQRLCPYTNEIKKFGIHIVCNLCQNERKVIHLNGIEFDLDEILMQMTTGVFNIEVNK